MKTAVIFILISLGRYDTPAVVIERFPTKADCELTADEIRKEERLSNVRKYICVPAHTKFLI